MNIPYQPNEYKDPSGKIVGFDVDLMDAVAATLGVKAEYLESAFEKIIPTIQAGTIFSRRLQTNISFSRQPVTAARYKNNIRPATSPASMLRWRLFQASWKTSPQ